MLTTKNIGDQAENIAATFLRQHGYKIVSTQAKTKRGEIDIIAEKGRSRLITEVRYRKSATFGRAEETVNKAKQKRIQLAAVQWIQQHDPQYNYSYRFDVIAMTGEARKADILWIKNAF